MINFYEYVYRKRDEINFYLLLNLFIVVPLIFYVKTQNIVFLKTLVAYFIAYTTFLIWLATSYYQAGRFKLLPSPINAPLVILLLYLGLNSAITVWRMPWGPPALEEMGNWSSYFLIALTIPRFANNMKKISIMLDTMVAVTFLVSLYMFGQQSLQKDFLSQILSALYNQPIFIWGGMANVPNVTTFGNKNFYCGYVDVTMPVCMVLALTTRRFWKIIFYLLTGFMTAYCIYASKTRGAILAMGGSLGVVGLFILINIRNIQFFKEKHRRQFSIGILVVAILTIGILAITKRNFIMRQLTPLILMKGNVLQVSRGTNLVRIRMWEGAMLMAIDHPIIGAGVGGFRAALPYYRPDMYHRSGVTHNTDHPHDEYLEYLGESGLIGLILWLSMYATIFIIGFRLLYKHRKDNYYLIILGILAGLLAEHIHNLVCVEFRWTGCAVSYWTAVGILLAIQYVDGGLWEKSKQIKNIRFPKKGMIAFAVAIGFIVFYFYLSHRLLLSDKYLIQGMTSLEGSGNVDAAIQLCEKSIELNPYEASGMYKGAFGYLKKDDHVNALRLYTMLTDILPNYAQIHNNIGLVYMRLNRIGLGLAHFERATIIEDNYKNHMALAQHWLRYGNWKKALYHLFRISRLTHDSDSGDSPFSLFHGRGNAYLLESQIAERFHNDIPKSERLLQKALQFDPTNKMNYAQMVNLLVRQNKFERAYQVANEGARLAGDLDLEYLDMLFRLGRQLNRTDELRSYFKQGIRIIENNYSGGKVGPNEERFINNFLMYASQQGNIGADPELVGLVGKCYYYVGQYPNAINFLSLALQRDPGNRDYRILIQRMKDNSLSERMRVER